MDCGIPVGLACDFFISPQAANLIPSSATTWKNIQNILGANLNRHFNNRGDNDEISVAARITSLCEDGCLRESIGLGGFLLTAPEGERIQALYERYKDNKIGRREFIEIVRPFLDRLEQEHGVSLGFVPVRGGFIVLGKDKNTFYGSFGSQVVTGSSLKEVLSGFANMTSILQVLDSSGKVIGMVETPASRVLDAMMFIEQNRSIWSTITGKGHASVNIDYSTNGYKITLMSPNNGTQISTSYGKKMVQGIGETSVRSLGLGYQIRSGDGSLQVGFSASEAKVGGANIDGIQGSYAHHLKIGDFTISGVSLRSHWAGWAEMRMQGENGKVTTGKSETEQSLIVSSGGMYGGIGVRGVWSPNLLKKDYRNINSEVIGHFGMKTGPYSASVSVGQSGYKMEGGIHDKNTACKATLDYQKRVSELLSFAKNVDVSCVWRF